MEAFQARPLAHGIRCHIDCVVEGGYVMTADKPAAAWHPNADLSAVWIDDFPKCPICRMYSEMHDRTLVGSYCNLQKPILRMLVPIRKAVRSFLRWIG